MKCLSVSAVAVMTLLASGCASALKAPLRINVEPAAELALAPDSEYLVLEFADAQARLGMGLLCPYAPAEELTIHQPSIAPHCDGGGVFGSFAAGALGGPHAIDRYQLADGRIVGVYRIGTRGWIDMVNISGRYVLAARAPETSLVAASDREMPLFDLKRGGVHYGGRVDARGKVKAGDYDTFAQAFTASAPSLAARLVDALSRQVAVGSETTRGGRGATCRFGDAARDAPGRTTRVISAGSGAFVGVGATQPTPNTSARSAPRPPTLLPTDG